MTRYDPNGTPAADPHRVTGRNAEGREITPIESVMDKADIAKLHELAEMPIPAASADPVKIEGLSPLPADLARQRTPRGVIPAGDGTSLPLVPRMARTIPAPFKRPSINWDDRHHGKTWHYARADSVEPGDIIVDFGRVRSVVPGTKYQDIGGVHVAVEVDITMFNIADKMMVVAPETQLQVFRVARDTVDE